MTKLYSYVVDHDYGRNPNPYGGMCTLVHCKYGGEGHKRNIVEMAEKGDWILGSGGMSSESTGKNDCIIYLMRVDEKLNFESYQRDPRFQGREDTRDNDENKKNLFALVSHHYFYFGKNAIDISRLPDELKNQNLLKTGQGYFNSLPQNFIDILVKFFEDNFEIGMYGYPCCQLDEVTVELKQNSLSSKTVTENTSSVIKESYTTNSKTKGCCR